MKKLLIDGVTATDATKQIFELTNDDFVAYPTIRGTGLGAGDVVTIWVKVAGVWVDTGDTLSNTVHEVVLQSFGTYAVSVVMTLTGPASVEVQTSGNV